MSVVSSVKDVLWARRRRPDEVRYFAALAHERFAPDDLLQQAIEAEQAGFDGVVAVDDRRDRRPDLRTAGRVRDRAEPDPDVPRARRRRLLRPPRSEMVARTEGAALYSRPPRRPPVYLSAFFEGAAELAGRLADGVWTLDDPEKAPKVISAYRSACEDAGREPDEIILQGVFSVAETDDAALEQACEWKGTMVDEHYTDPIADPAAIYRRGEQEVDDSTFTKQIIAAADPDTHVKRIKTLEKLGATTMVLMNVSGKDPHAALRVYGEQVLPALRER